MPLPVLPFDIIAEIVTHLGEMLCESDRLVAEGKTISLACKEWKPLGQALCWKAVEISFSQVIPLLDHFSRHPHLTKLVHLFTIEELAETSGDLSAQLSDLIRLFVNLRGCTFLGKLDNNLPPLLLELSQLQHLAFCNIGSASSAEWKNETKSIFAGGFRKLSHLTLMTPRLIVSIPSHQNVNVIQDSKLLLSNLTLGWTVESSEATKAADDFLSLVDPTSLRVVDLTHSAACVEAIRWLSICPLLRSLTVNLYPLALFEDLVHILSLLPRFPSLKAFAVKVLGIDEVQPVTSPVPLPAVLASFPPSLRYFKAEQLVFVDFAILPQREISAQPDLETRVILALRPGSSEVGGGVLREAVYLLVWGKENDGSVNWFCDVSNTKKEEDKCTSVDCELSLGSPGDLSISLR